VPEGSVEAGTRAAVFEEEGEVTIVDGGGGGGGKGLDSDGVGWERKMEDWWSLSWTNSRREGGKEK